jgi:hypothetical protein
MTVIEKIQRDSLAIGVARALALANETAVAAGIDPQGALVTISEEASPPTRSWRIHYGPRDYINQRGGDITILVDGDSGEVKKVLRGQ